MPGEGVGVRACVHRPQSHRIVINPTGPTCDCISIGTERYAIDVTRMLGEGAGVCPRVQVPQPHRMVFIPSTANKRPAIGTERYAMDPTRMPGEGVGSRLCWHPTAAPYGLSNLPQWRLFFHRD